MNYNKLRNAVENNKITITEMCKKIHIDRKTFYNNLENKTLKVETLENICTLLGLNITVFFENTQITYSQTAALTLVNEAESHYGIDYKQKYLETLEKLNYANERVLAFTDLKKGIIKNK